MKLAIALRAYKKGSDRRANAERLMRTIKEEEVELSEYRNFEEAYQEIGKFLDDVYTKKRIHSSLGYLTPIEAVPPNRIRGGRLLDCHYSSRFEWIDFGSKSG